MAAAKKPIQRVQKVSKGSITLKVNEFPATGLIVDQWPGVVVLGATREKALANMRAEAARRYKGEYDEILYEGV